MNSFTGNKQPAQNLGRPPGSLNKITRTMKDAAVAAAEELGHHDRDQWTLVASKGDPNGMKHFFMVMAVENMRTFGAILARIMQLHVQATGMPAYLTEEQAIAELKTYGLPSNLIEHLHSIDESEKTQARLSRVTPRFQRLAAPQLAQSHHQNHEGRSGRRCRGAGAP
jgi:hypothetical protein